ncbi:AfsR/SARP family transcriptional regulator [Corynebacterium halotolerans]|uniref:ATPase-like protein n=1 Tax=Corynebacterium halotolerans YIM 70093 = DSM 44683 TaxID=1121362 RepID=M1P8H1_9CORY|nr:BTAD domain-containing putative transcriptional regulator [Corynebacterium halotolerans]AGF72961.1 ATPase-like protein [Corynebacterium halotolerans YIM 70093 = DSM 44683]
MAGAPVQIDVLGSLEIRRAGARVELRGSRPRAALAALLVHAPYPVSPDGLAAAIWEKELPARPRGAVQTVVSRLRSVLGDEVVRHDPVGYHLELPAGTVDADRFEALCRQAGELPTSRAAEMLDSALGLWRGPAYAEFADREFAVTEAVRLGELRMKAMEDRAVLALELDDADASVSVLQGVVAEQPLRERAHGLLMTALYRAGRTTEALEQYQALRRSLVEELGLDPSPALRELQVQILDHAVPESSVARPPPRRVPPSWEPATGIFIGREDDTGELLRAAAAHRLVSVTGPGGVGKSRLVAEVLPELTRRLDRPAAVVELEDAQPEQVDEKVAASLGLGFAAEPRAAVLEYLAASSLILVLDACERVLDRTRSLVREILWVAPRVNLVVTSRHRLDMGAEQVLPLSPLTPPDPTDGPDRAVLAPAMRLFIERLRRARPATDLSVPLVRDAGEVCRRLDGLPLALELAATQAATLGVRTVLTGFGTGLHLAGSAGTTAALRRGPFP